MQRIEVITGEQKRPRYTPEENGSGWLSTSGIMQCLGKISYSVYLRHWPFYLYIYITFGGVTYTTISVGIFLSVLADGISYKLIEDTLKKPKRYINITLFSACLVTSLAVCKMSGMESQLRPISQTADNSLVKYYENYVFDKDGLWEKCNASEKLKNIDKSCIAKDNAGGVILMQERYLLE